MNCEPKQTTNKSTGHVPSPVLTDVPTLGGVSVAYEVDNEGPVVHYLTHTRLLSLDEPTTD